MQIIDITLAGITFSNGRLGWLRENSWFGNRKLSNTPTKQHTHYWQLLNSFPCFYVYLLVQFYPWFKFYFPLFFRMVMLKMNLKQRKIEFEPRIKLNHNIYHLWWTRLEVKFENNNCLLMSACFFYNATIKKPDLCMVG